jgi:hypothetical protein
VAERGIGMAAGKYACRGGAGNRRRGVTGR